MARILVACEESQVVTKAFRDKGHEAYSCDIEPCSGGHPEWHLFGDALLCLRPDYWDLLIAFPPCTHLACSGARWFTQKRADGRQQTAVDFFMELANASIPRIAIENPIGIMSTQYRKPDQIIQPWQFGHPETKATCLWLHNLPPLTATHVVKEEMEALPPAQRHRVWYMPPGAVRAKLRSKTFTGIAEAMADQWSPLLDHTEPGSEVEGVTAEDIAETMPPKAYLEER